ncbi:MAG: HAMP domain-containing sensor histidine kinase [Bacteroidia bacterium]
MKIRTRLALQFTLIVGCILFISALAIYFSSSTYRHQEFIFRLKDKAQTTAHLLIEVQGVDQDLLRLIDRNTITLPLERIWVFNYLNEEIYDSKPGEKQIEIREDLLNTIRLEEDYIFNIDGKETAGILYADKYNRFVVIASAYDRFGLSKLNNLRIVLIIVFFLGVAIAGFAGWLFAWQALLPISSVIEQVDKISISNIHSRVNEGNKTDEIALLAITFNKMLERLEAAFEMQRSFVANASHELRTPLTSITGNIEVTLHKNRDIKEYEDILTSILEDIKHLTNLTNGLLDLAYASRDISEIKMEDHRIDDLIWQARAQLLKQNPACKIIVEFVSIPDDESLLCFRGSEQLLKTAFINLMDNACKFSPDKSVFIYIEFIISGIDLIFKDNGPGIPEEDQPHLFQPFFRAANTRHIKGHGLGLSMTQRIIQLHGGKITVSRTSASGTEITVHIPALQQSGISKA